MRLAEATGIRGLSRSRPAKFSCQIQWNPVIAADFQHLALIFYHSYPIGNEEKAGTI
jgi:hypothetical protein